MLIQGLLVPDIGDNCILDLDFSSQSSTVWNEGYGSDPHDYDFPNYMV